MKSLEEIRMTEIDPSDFSTYEVNDLLMYYLFETSDNVDSTVVTSVS